MRIGIDLGGSKIEIIALDSAGQTLARQRIATPQGDYAATLSAIVDLVRETETRLGQRGAVGIGIPGAESLFDGRIKNANSTCLIGRPLKRDLEERLKRAIRLANDANCFTLSEATDGSAAGAKTVFGVILGTGVGGGIVVNGQLLNGVNAIAGEWGHNPLPVANAEDFPLPACYCGRQGCIETYLSGPALSRQHQTAYGESLIPSDIAERADQGDPHCLASMARYEARLGRALATVINILDPEIIVLGGGLSRLTRLYRQLPAACAPHVFSEHCQTRFLPPQHGDASGVRGAAWLWPLDEMN